MSYITTKGNTQLFYKDWGSGKPVIFLHGWPLSSDSCCDNPLGSEQGVFEAIATSMKEGRASFFADFFKTFYGVSMLSQPASQEVLEWSRSVSMRANLKTTLACAQAFSSADFRPDLSAFKVPTLIIHCTDDKTVPIDVSGRAAARSVPHADVAAKPIGIRSW